MAEGRLLMAVGERSSWSVLGMQGGSGGVGG